MGGMQLNKFQIILELKDWKRISVILKKKNKMLRARLQDKERENQTEDFTTVVAVHGSDAVYSPICKSEPVTNLSSIFDTNNVNSSRIENTSSSVGVLEQNDPNVPPGIVSSLNVQKKKSSNFTTKGKPKVGKKKKKKKISTSKKQRHSIIPVEVNGLDDFGSTEENFDSETIKCDICHKNEQNGLLICSKCSFKAHENCVGDKDWRTNPEIEEWTCSSCLRK